MIGVRVSSTGQSCSAPLLATEPNVLRMAQEHQATPAKDPFAACRRADGRAPIDRDQRFRLIADLLYDPVPAYRMQARMLLAKPPAQIVDREG